MIAFGGMEFLNESHTYDVAGVCMKKLVRKNYLLPAEVTVKLRALVKSRRYATESEAIRKSLQHLIELESRRADQVSRELDELAKETSKYLPKTRTAGQLVHQAHVEESHGP